MRTFYIFKIKKHYALLTFNNPDILFRALDKMYNSQENEVEKSVIFFKQITIPIMVEKENNFIYDKFKDKYSYTRFRNKHIWMDYYRKEKTKLTILSDYMLLQSNLEVPTFFTSFYEGDGNWFLCDFEEKDYFWLKNLCCNGQMSRIEQKFIV